MRVALITSEFVTESVFDGGLANYIFRVAKALIQLNHIPVVFVSSVKNETFYYEGIRVERVLIWKDYPWGHKNKLLDKFDKVLNYKYNMVFSLLWQSYKLNRKLWRINKIEKFDIVQYSHLGGVGLFKPFSYKAVARISSSTKLCYEAGGYGDSAFQIQQQEYIEKIALKRMKGIFGPSIKIAKYVQSMINKKIEVIESPFFMDVSVYDFEKYNELLKDRKYILFFGTLSYIKGVHVIAEIIHDFLSKYPSNYFVFIGKQSFYKKNRTFSELINEKSFDCRGRVIFIESLKHELLYPIIEKAQFVVLPSIVDNFPNTCIEAMAHKKIVIGTIGNGFEQLIDNGESGFLVQPGNAEELSITIDKIMELTNEQKQSIGENAKTRIEKLKPEIVVNELIEFYEKIIRD